MNPVQITILAFMAAMTVICVAGICYFIYDAVTSFLTWRSYKQLLKMETKYMNWLIENKPMDKEVPPGAYAIRGDDGAFYTFETTQPIPEGGVIRIEEKGEYNGNNGRV